MPIVLKLEVQGGAEKYQVALKDLADNVKDFYKLFEWIMDYFEGQEINFKNTIQGKDGPRVEQKRLKTTYKSPIEEIWKSKGQLIQANWGNSPLYETWKSKNWPDMREFPVPINIKNEQILTGRTLYHLLNSDTDSIRLLDSISMTYGVKIPYAAHWQEKRKILDFFPEMIKDINKIVAAWVRDIAAVEWENQFGWGE